MVLQATAVTSDTRNLQILYCFEEFILSVLMKKGHIMTSLLSPFVSAPKTQFLNLNFSLARWSSHSLTLVIHRISALRRSPSRQVRHSSFIWTMHFGEWNLLRYSYITCVTCRTLHKNPLEDVNIYKMCCVNAPFTRSVTLFFILSVFYWLLPLSVIF